MKTNLKTTIETAVKNKRIIEQHESEKMIWKFLVYYIHYHGLICFNPKCKINHFADVVSNILLG